jgi:hypothetical protein
MKTVCGSTTGLPVYPFRLFIQPLSPNSISATNMIFENRIRRNARKASISRCKDTLWVPIIALDEATRKSGMTDDGRSMA